MRIAPLLWLAACGTTQTFADPGAVCLQSGELRAVHDDDLRYGCGDEVLAFICTASFDGEQLVVTSELEVHEGPSGCGAYDNSFYPSTTCEVPEGAEGAEVRYGGEVMAWDALPSCVL